MDRLPSLNAIRSFAAAAQHESFTAAAQELNVTQGAVSRMVQSLELELGAQLFTRNGRFIALTPAGRTYHAAVREALGQIAVASSRLRQSVGDEALSLIAHPGFATRWLIPRLPAFHKAQPGIRINLLGSDADDHSVEMQALVVIRYGTGPWPGSVATRLPVGAVLGVVCAEHHLKSGALGSPSDLVGRPLIAHSVPARDFWHEFFDHFDATPPDLSQVPRFHQITLMAEAALSGLGFALVPLFLFEPELRSGRLVQAIPQTFTSKRSYYVTHALGADRDRRVSLFKSWLVAQARLSAKPWQKSAPARRAE